jgi:integrase
MTDTRRLRRVAGKSRADDTRNIYRRYQMRDGREEPVPTGRATAYVVILSHKGREFRRYAPTQAAAIRTRDELRQMLRDGDDPDRQTITFQSYADDWISRYKGKNGGIRAETKREYEAELELAKTYFAGKKLAAIKARDAEAYIEHVRATRGRKRNDGTRAPARDGTIRNAIAPLRALFFDALKNELVRSNPFSRIAVSAVVEEAEANAHAGDDATAPKKHLEPDELRRFLGALSSPPMKQGDDLPSDGTPGHWRLLGEFLAQTGLRISEAIALRWEDLDIEKRVVHVRWRIYRGTRGRPKSKNAVRDVPLSPGVAAKLADHRRTTPFNTPRSPVFASSAGTHLDSTNIYRRVFKPAFVAAGVPWAGFHSLRHTAASFYFRARTEGGAAANIKQVSVLLGHHHPGFTLATYVHLFDDEKLPDPTPFDAFISDGSKNGSRTDRHRPARRRKMHKPEKPVLAATSSTRA